MVTGASKGIGAAVARGFGAGGASVVVNYSSSNAAADKVVDDFVEAGGAAIAFKANMREPAEVEQPFAEADRAHGRVNVLVNNAGVCDF